MKWDALARTPHGAGPRPPPQGFGAPLACVAVRQPLEHRGHRPLGQDLVAVACPAGHLAQQGVRVVALLGRLRPPPSIQGVRGLVVFGLASGMDGPLDQPRGPLPPPRPPAAPPPGQSGPFAWSPAGPGPRAGPPAPGSRRRPLLSTRPRASGTAGAGSWPDRWHRRPADADTGPAVQRCPAAVRPLDPVGHHQVGCSSGSPSRYVRWSNPTPSSPCPATCSCPPWPRRVPMWVSR
jgi:hypothetical protein